MSKKIIVIVIILVLIGGVLLFLSWQRVPSNQPIIKEQFPVTNEFLVINQPVANQEIIPPRELTEEEKLTLLNNELKIKARNFAERYGSYSTDGKFQNLKDLKNEMTLRFWQETENYILAQEKEEIKEFYGVTTRVLNVTEKNFSENEVEYLISTQREEIKGIQSPQISYQNLELKMIQENGEWKVDHVAWRM